MQSISCSILIATFLVVSSVHQVAVAAKKDCNVNITSTTSPLSVNTINAILMAHNLARVQVSPPPAEMQLLRWSDALAREAASYIGSCPGFKHSATSFRQNKAGFAYIGENLAAGINPLSTNNLGFGTSINMWNAEDKFYGYTSATCPGTQSYCGTCVAGEQCGHYTQNVWANTSEIGCAYQLCNDATKHYYICWYGAGGNLWGAAPYVSAASAGADVCTPTEVMTGFGGTPVPPPGPGPAPAPAPEDDGKSGKTAVIAGVCVAVVVLLVGAAVFFVIRNRNPPAQRSAGNVVARDDDKSSHLLALADDGSI